MSNVKVKVKNIDSVTFGKAVIETKLRTRFDSDVDKDRTQEVTLRFKLSDSDEVKELVMDRLGAALRIKANTPGGDLKGLAVDQTSYEKVLKDNDYTFEFDLDEWLKPSERGEIDPIKVGNKAVTKMNAEQLEAFKKQIEAMQAKAKKSA